MLFSFVGIVGHEALKFTPETEAKAKALIASLVGPSDIVVSGHCHLGGIDIWAEEYADANDLVKIIHPPKTLAWASGYKPRNILIAKDSEEVHCIVVKEYPPDYKGMRFDSCYHCGVKTHVKSGGCWTAHYAKRVFHKPIYIHEI